MKITEFTRQMNEWGRTKVPFLFVVDFEMENAIIVKLEDVDANEILFDVNGRSNYAASSSSIIPSIVFNKKPMAASAYDEKFKVVFDELCYGDSFLTNLTIKTEIDLTCSLKQLFDWSRARYKLLFRNEFLVFSPETIIQISAGRIFSYPMKGTIDATIEGAAEKILNDKKEMAEHVTIVDLIRNDLSQVARNVEVKRFRYIEEIKTNHKNLLQVSSEIVGTLPADYTENLGTILMKLLPAGSVSGAPKPKTLEIIRQAEQEKRGFYTGVFGYFDGERLDSAVMIRFIEKKAEKYFYRSGGGITTQSISALEYQEAIDKVYVPVD